MTPSEPRKVARSQAVLLAAYAGTILLMVVTRAVLGRTASAEALGFFTLVTTVFAVARMVFDSGTPSVAVREIAREPARERPLLEGLIAWRRLLGAVLGLAVVVYALREDDAVRTAALAATGAVLALQGPTALYPAFQVRQVQGPSAILGTAGLAATLAGVLVLDAAGVDGPHFAWLVVARELVSAFIFGALARKLLGYRPQPGFRGRGLRAFARSSLLNGLATLSYAVSCHVGVFLVRALRGEAELGAYGAALGPVSPLLLLPSILLIPVLPVLAEARRSDFRDFAARVRDLCAVLAGIGALGGVAGFMLARELLEVLYGGRYLDGPLSAVDSLRWLSIAFAITFASAPFIPALLVAGAERWLLALGVSGLAANIAINALLLPSLGFDAAALSIAATAAVVGAGGLLGFTAIGARAPLSPARLKVLLPAALLAALLSIPGGPPLLRVSLGVLLALAGLLWLFSAPEAKRLRRDEKPAATESTAPVGERQPCGLES